MKRSVALATLLLILFSSTMPAAASPTYNTAYYYNSPANMNGVSALIAIGSNYGSANYCTLNFLDLQSSATNIEVGSYRCAGSNIDGTCGASSLHFYEETFTIYGYLCADFGAASYYTSYAMEARQSGSYFYGYINYVQHNGLTMSGQLSTQATAEEVGNHQCDGTWTASASYSGWMYRIGIYWSTMNSASSNIHCWYVGPLSGGNFGASH